MEAEKTKIRSKSKFEISKICSKAVKTKICLKVVQNWRQNRLQNRSSKFGQFKKKRKFENRKKSFNFDDPSRRKRLFKLNFRKRGCQLRVFKKGLEKRSKEAVKNSKILTLLWLQQVISWSVISRLWVPNLLN